jgi:predicted peroxiredoxin
MKKLRSLLALTCFAGIGIAQAEPVPVTVIINSASTMTQGIALVLTNQMQSQGGQIQILLCDKAGDLALKDAGGDKLKPQNLSPAQMLDNAMKNGVTVSVCALYLPNSGNTPDRLKDGITPAKPDAIGKAIMEPQRKVLVF